MFGRFPAEKEVDSLNLEFDVPTWLTIDLKNVPATLKEVLPALSKWIKKGCFKSSG